MHSSYFVLKNKEGKQAEQIVKDYLTGRGYTVQDVSEEQDNYQNDIDFIVQKVRTALLSGAVGLSSTLFWEQQHEKQQSVKCRCRIYLLMTERLHFDI